MVYLFIKTAICFFALVGMCLTVLWIFDLYTSKQTGIHARLVITHIDNTQNTEYAIRILEGQLAHSLFGKYIYEIVADFPDAQAHLIDKLQKEYGNIKKEV